jgi:hypothetical protein
MALIAAWQQFDFVQLESDTMLVRLPTRRHSNDADRKKVEHSHPQQVQQRPLRAKLNVIETAQLSAVGA